MEQRERSGRTSIALRVVVATLLTAAAAAATGTPAARPAPTSRRPAQAAAPGKPVAPVTDATVAARVLAANTKADHEALAQYYQDEAAGEAARIAHFDELFRTYMKMEGKEAEILQRHSRALLKAARMAKQRYEELAKTHRTIAWEWDD